MGRDPFNQSLWKFWSKTQWIGSVQPEKFRKTGPPEKMDHFSWSDWSKFWLSGSRLWRVSSVSWAGPFCWDVSANTLVPFQIFVLLIYEAVLTHLPKSWLRQPVSRQPGLSYKHSKHFIRTQRISQASQTKQTSWANRAGSLHINRPLTLCSHYARYLCAGKKTIPGIGLLFTLKNCDFGAISVTEQS